MAADNTSPVDTTDPALLAGFHDDLRAHGFAALDEGRRRWEGPCPDALATHTTATTMRIVLRDGWPYRPPQVDVDDIDSWHADQDHLCLWQEGDDTRTWVTVEGIHRRIEEWVADAGAGFVQLGVALDPHLHFETISNYTLALDVDAIVGGAYQDGQHGFLHVTLNHDTFWRAHPGRPPAGFDQPALEGRWFYRAALDAPPRNPQEFRAALTNTHHRRLDSHLARHDRGVFLLLWSTPHGIAALPVLIDQHNNTPRFEALHPVSVAGQDLLRRAGPDAELLRDRHAVLLGVGAIGSHVGALMARSGIGQLTLVDADWLWPTGHLRHAAEAAVAGYPKPLGMQHTLRHLDWVTVVPEGRNPWSPTELRTLIEEADLVVEATGSTPFAELVSRVATDADVPMVSVALYRGGDVARVRRQTAADVPILQRRGHWRYPAIPPADDEDDNVGVEIGCAAPIHNAPPIAVTHAAVLGSRVAVDVLTSRHELPDEWIEVLRPGAAPYDRAGPVARPDPPPVQITEDAAAAMRAAAAAARPNETGGVLVGLHDQGGAPIVTRAIELPAAQPSPARFRVEEGATSAATDAVRDDDDRLGYLGEWHSHPTAQAASSIDAATMRQLAESPATGATPILAVLVPAGDGYDIASYMVVDGALAPVGHELVGALPPASTADGSS